MRPASFSYQRPASVMEAVQLISGSGDAKLLAGGHSLLPAMKQRLSQPGVIVDIGRLDALRGISVNGNSLNIGALTTHAQVAASPTVRAHCRALAQACSMVGDAQVRNVGTLGGNLAHADPASDPPTVVLAAGGKLHAQGANGGRTINAGDFFVNFFTTDLQPGEILTSIELPIVNGRRSAYEKLQHPASRYAVTGVAVFLDVQNGTCTGASVAVGGATPKATRSPGAESTLVGSTLDAAACDAAANALMSEIADSATGDIYAPADYRVAMAGVLLKRAISAAMQ